MKKKGFIFVETIVVLVITMLSLTMLLSSYLLVVRKNNINKYYNRPSEMYSLYYISKLGTTSASNYVTSESSSIYIRKGTCASTIMNSYLTDCTDVFDTFDMQAFGIINDINTELNEHSDSYDNGTLEFLDHLQKEIINDSGSTVKMRYVIGVFYINREYYYAAIPIVGGA